MKRNMLDVVPKLNDLYKDILLGVIWSYNHDKISREVLPFYNREKALKAIRMRLKRLQRRGAKVYATPKIIALLETSHEEDK